MEGDYYQIPNPSGDNKKQNQQNKRGQSSSPRQSKPKAKGQTKKVKSRPAGRSSSTPPDSPSLPRLQPNPQQIGQQQNFVSNPIIQASGTQQHIPLPTNAFNSVYSPSVNPVTLPPIRSLEDCIRRTKDKQKQNRLLSLWEKCDKKSVDIIQKEIIWDNSGLGVTFDDVIGLEGLKGLLREMVVFPIQRPDLFTGLRAPPRGLLLFGPPGTGKTLVAKALANDAQARFFSISAASLTSKWVGESEKMVQALFSVAAVAQPSIIFIDEIDSLLTQRGDQENEASRRLKTEIFIQMDGVSTAADDHVILIGATNRPFDLDDAVLRRLSRRVYLPLPDKSGRKKLIKVLLDKHGQDQHSITKDQLDDLADNTKFFSNADLMQLCKDAAFGPIRELDGTDFQNISKSSIRKINLADFTRALHNVKPTADQKLIKKYQQWNEQFGSSANK
ncbi:MAG: putative Protein SAP1 [Streblomastix strix]|uniref:AAA+ ATPase domain-containing protein n=1 Tax=Streblomastix strix TaxID=222440 RepID=A0A5J4WM41_9EUKA|nr:MAG: putative Protein SAP1 [Streblomastix strix]